MDAEKRQRLEGAGILSRLPCEARVLVIRLRSMGDTILMTPALRLLRDWRPDLRVSVLVERPWDELLEGNPAVHSVIAAGPRLLTAWRLRRASFSLAINLHGGPTSAFLTRMSGAAWRAGFDHFRDNFIYNLSVPTAQRVLAREGPVHTAEHVAACFFWLGVPPAEIPSSQIVPSAGAVREVAERLIAMGLRQGEEYAVLHPAASYASKQWKASGFAEVGAYLESEFGPQPIYVCGKDESDVLDEVESNTGRPILRAAGWSMRNLAALTAGARVFVGNDSGPAHLAAALGIPVLVIFGSSHAAVWRPWKASSAAVVQNYFDCNPCPGDRCAVYQEPRCILSITTEEVKAGLEGLLRSRPAARL